MLNLTFPRPKQANKWRPLERISVAWLEAWLEARQWARSREYDGDKSSGCTQENRGVHCTCKPHARLGLAPCIPAGCPPWRGCLGGSSVCACVCVRACLRACVWPRPCSGAAAPVASEKRQTNSPAEPPGPRSRLGRDAAPLQAPFPVLTLSRQGRRGS